MLGHSCQNGTLSPHQCPNYYSKAHKAGVSRLLRAEFLFTTGVCTEQYRRKVSLCNERPGLPSQLSPAECPVVVCVQHPMSKPWHEG